MTELKNLSRRERQIMDVVFAEHPVTVNTLCDRLEGHPTPMAVRRMLAILTEKGHLRRRKRGREYVYLPRENRTRAGLKALRGVLTTFFDGSIGSALAVHLEKPGTEISDDDLARLTQLVDELRAQRGDS